MDQPRELTFKAVALGLFLAFLFGAANAYLGMKAGQTVAATIPAAVIAMTLFKIRGMRGGVLEQNIARTAASVGEALVSGAIFVIPSFLMVDMNGRPLWADLRSHYWQASMLLVTGGMLGVLFTILIRRPLFADKTLPWPESVASVEIIRAGSRKIGSAAAHFRIAGVWRIASNPDQRQGSSDFSRFDRWILCVPAIGGAAFQFRAAADRQCDLRRRGVVDHALAFTRAYWDRLHYRAEPGGGERRGRCARVVDSDSTAAVFRSDLPRRLGNAAPDVAAFTVWYNIVRPIAVGAMMVGAANTMFSMRRSLIDSVRGAFAGARRPHPKRLANRICRCAA